MNPFLESLIGGMLIGLSSSLLLLFNGRILGISGIIGGLFNKQNRDKAWRFYFILGLLGGGILYYYFHPENFVNNLIRPNWLVCVAGLLVGFGTSQANGCTSGHGVCGISRFSPRSILATLTFMFFGALAVFVQRHLLGVF